MGKLVAALLVLAFAGMCASCGGEGGPGPEPSVAQTPQPLATPLSSYEQPDSGELGALDGPVGYTLESGGLRVTITDMYLSRSDSSSPLKLVADLTAYNAGQSPLTLTGEDFYLVHRGRNIGHAAIDNPVELGPGESWQATLVFDPFQTEEHVTLVVSSGESILQFAIQTPGKLRIEPL